MQIKSFRKVCFVIKKVLVLGTRVRYKMKTLGKEKRRLVKAWKRITKFSLLIRQEYRKISIRLACTGYMLAHALMLILLHCILNIKP